MEEREEISRGLAAGLSLRLIAEHLGRAPSTICREVSANGGRRRDRALVAERAGVRAGQTTQGGQAGPEPPPAGQSGGQLQADGAPEEISGWLARTYANAPEMCVAHESIYQSIFVQGRGALRHELHVCLRSGRAMRRNKKWVKAGHGLGKIRDLVMITERPAEATDRAVPGHWAGDLIMGKGFTSVGTLVERKTRSLLLIRLPQGRGAEAFRDALTIRIVTLPAQLRRSITTTKGPRCPSTSASAWTPASRSTSATQEPPAARHQREHQWSAAPIPAQRTDLSIYTQRQLDATAKSLNTRPPQDPGLYDTIGGVRRGLCDDRLNPQVIGGTPGTTAGISP
jgi:IS30 family transposase